MTAGGTYGESLAHECDALTHGLTVPMNEVQNRFFAACEDTTRRYCLGTRKQALQIKNLLWDLSDPPDSRCNVPLFVGFPVDVVSFKQPYWITTPPILLHNLLSSQLACLESSKEMALSVDGL